MSTNSSKQIEIPLSKLKQPTGVQSRVNNNSGTIKEYAERLAAGDTFPPPDVVEESNGEYLVADGNHRVEAVQRNDPNGMITVNVYQAHKGLTPRETAIYMSCTSNHTHGLRLKSADKVNVVRMYLSLPGNAEKTDVQIATELKVSRRNGRC